MISETLPLTINSSIPQPSDIRVNWIVTFDRCQYVQPYNCKPYTSTATSQAIESEKSLNLNNQVSVVITNLASGSCWFGFSKECANFIYRDW